MDTYEKKYKESLALMVDCIPDEDGYVHVRPQDIFPELKGSRDEKIRKTLIDFFQDWRKNRSHCWGISVPEILTWLEKQGTSYTKRDVDNAYVEGMAFAKNELEKQGNSFIKWNKNTKDNKPQFNHSVLFQTKFDVIAEGEWNGKEWLQYRWGCGIDDSAVTCWMELSALKKQGEQKHDWSEEDEHRIKDTIYFLETAKKHYASTVELDACINRLKSIKERYTWKPSDEQMEAVKEAACYSSVFSEKTIDNLISLSEQLKKLKA